MSGSYLTDHELDHDGQDAAPSRDPEGSGPLRVDRAAQNDHEASVYAYRLVRRD